MTKINKLGKSTFVVAILSFILVAVLAFGGTYAYFSATAGQAAGKVTTGHLRMEITEDAAIEKINGYTMASKTIVQPGQVLVGTTEDNVNIPAKVTASVDANINYYIRVKFDVKVTNHGAEHNGIITPDDLLTDGDQTEKDATVGTGDHVADDIAILEILLKVKAGSGAVETWKEYMPDTTTHTGYFYGTSGAVDGTVTKREASETATVYDMDVLVNLQDWVGAYGCTYYMDAGIEIRFQVETLQADFLDSSKLKTFEGEIDTVKELHDTWAAAVALSQPPVVPAE